MRFLRAFLLHTLTLLLVGLPPAAVLRIILKYGRNIPWMDQWHIPATILVSHLRGTLALSDFFQAHNESVKAFSGLLWFLLARNGWQPRTEMVVTWFVTVALAIVLYFLLCRTLTRTGRGGQAIFVLMVLILFHPGAVNHWLTGLRLENALVIFLLAAGLFVNGLSLPAWSKYLLAACFSLAGTFCYANGMLLWVLICPGLPLFSSTTETAGIRSRNRVLVLLYLCAGFASIICFFSVLAACPHDPIQTDLIMDAPLSTFIFLLCWLGAPFSLPGADWFTPCAGSVLLILFLVPLVSFIGRKRRGEGTTAFRSWLLIAFYVLSTGGMVAVGRQNFGIEVAFATRYFIHSVMLPIAIAPLAYLMLRDGSTAGGRGRLFLTLYGALSGLMVIACTVSVICQWNTADARARGFAHKCDRGAVALSFIKAIPRNPELGNIAPMPTFLNAHARALVRHGLLDFPLHQPPPMGSDRPAETRIHGLHVKLREQRALVVRGLCPKRHPGGEISHLLLTSFHGHRPEKAFAVITPELSRHPRQVEGATETSIRFQSHVSTIRLEPGPHLVKAWAFDASSGEYTPLASQWRIHHKADGR